VPVTASWCCITPIASRKCSKCSS